jgi:hypothetical protein
MGISPSLIMGGLSAAGGLAGLFGNQGSNTQAPQQWQMPGMTGAANNALQGIGNLGQYNTYGMNLNQAGGIAEGLVNNPYSGGFQQGANTAGGLGQLQALGQYGTGQQVSGMGTNQLAPYAGAVMNTAFDPQNALYNQSLQQTTAQQNAQNAAAGVGQTPYGAGLQDQNLQNFNIGWQNQQLGRQTQGLQAAGGALTQAGGLAQLGQGLSSGAVGQYGQASAMPYNAYSQIGQGQLGALGTLGQFGQAAGSQAQTPIQDYLSYLGQGTAQQGANNQTANLAFQQQQQYGNQLGQGLQGIFGGLGGMGMGAGGWASGNYGGSNPFNNSQYSAGYGSGPLW